MKIFQENGNIISKKYFSLCRLHMKIIHLEFRYITSLIFWLSSSCVGTKQKQNKSFRKPRWSYNIRALYFIKLSFSSVAGEVHIKSMWFLFVLIPCLSFSYGQPSTTCFQSWWCCHLALFKLLCLSWEIFYSNNHCYHYHYKALAVISTLARLGMPFTINQSV